MFEYKINLYLDVILKDLLLFLNMFLCFKMLDYKKKYFFEDENYSFLKKIFLCFF